MYRKLMVFINTVYRAFIPLHQKKQKQVLSLHFDGTFYENSLLNCILIWIKL